MRKENVEEKQLTQFAWAIIGPGAIAHRFAEAIQLLPNTYLHAVCGRQAERTARFAVDWASDGRAPRVLSHIDDLLNDARIDGVYIATPHAFHGEMVQHCLAAGKPVLCEKPLAPNKAQAEALVALSRERKVFLMEALWTRFLPIYEVVANWLATDAIGKVHGIQSSFCFHPEYDPQGRLFNPALAGGSLLDIGVYNVAMTRWILEVALGRCPGPLAIHAHGVLAPTGVDQRVACTINFPGGVSSQFICAFDTCADNALSIFGERGSICLPHHFWEATQAILHIHDKRPLHNCSERSKFGSRSAPVRLYSEHRRAEIRTRSKLCRGLDNPPQEVHAPMRINGFEGEVEEAMRCIRGGLVESQRMPHAETLAIIAYLDEIRNQLGVRYPFEA